MKFAYGLAMSAALAFAPLAQAQISCSQIEELTAMAMDEFDDIIGDEIGDSVYATTYELAQAQGCQITYEMSINYACMWAYDSAGVAAADFALQSQALGKCVADWDRDTTPPEDSQEALKLLDRVSYFREDEDGGELTWFSYVEEHIEGDVHDWHVWVGVDYF